MFFKFQNFSNGQYGSPLSFAVKPLFILGTILIILGLLITAYPEIFAGVVAFVLYFIAGICLIYGFKLWRLGKKMAPPSGRPSEGGDTIHIDVDVLESK